MQIKMTRKGESLKLTAESAGIVLGMIAGWTVGILLGSWIIHAILAAVKLGSLTYAQVVGLVAIWEIVKPRTETK